MVILSEKVKQSFTYLHVASLGELSCDLSSFASHVMLDKRTAPGLALPDVTALAWIFDRASFRIPHSFQGYEGSLLKITSKNGKTSSPVGFVTFNTRNEAEAAKNRAQVS